MSSRLKLAFKLSLTSALLVVVFATAKDDFAHAMNQLNASTIPWFLFAMAACGIDVLLSGRRQLATLRVLAPDCRYWKIVAITYAGLFANLVMPGGTGLDACRILYIHRPGGVDHGHVGGWVLLDKAIAALAVLLVAVVALAGASASGIMAFSRVSFAFVAIALTALVGAMGVLFALRSLRLSRLAEKAALRFHFIDALRRIVRLFQIKRYSLADLAMAVVYAVAGRLALMAGVAALAYPFYGFQGALLALVLSPLVMAANQLPVTPGNLGWTEASAALVWQLFNSEGGGIIFLLWRIAQIAFAAGGAVILMLLKRSPSTKAQTTEPPIVNPLPSQKEG
ncbi:MAG: lysylphosphatidylglycerol synthase transmembrane domain-containing protein [Desulfovibrionaceae bacterium]